ncbi:hypothetical protein SEA_SERENITY_95 [Mycobacterium phage Serenity]|uniref:hypothetical protein n=1 Tax=Mycobacterium phage Serenity TaxID=1701853 RepID=UPI0006CE3FF6|nr:hypothetical protein SEA_SERENITY_95 [Mycobacterium phage Serenity]ALF00962.1 hypothetical protein SEA_SERENITY_95 [Mycobacterium phage Serenity]
MSFQLWMANLDAYMQETFGVGRGDIADWTYRDAYDDGLTFREAAHRAINHEFL